MTEVLNFGICLNFTYAMVTKNGRQNRHIIEKLPFLTKIKAFRDRILKNKISAQLYTKKSFKYVVCHNNLIICLLVLYFNCSVKRLKFATKQSISYFQLILAAFFVTTEMVKVKLISDIHLGYCSNKLIRRIW